MIRTAKQFEYLFGKDPYIETNKGWNKLINLLILIIYNIDKDKKIRVEQVKEKFGGLRFYVSYDDYNDIMYKKISNIIRIFEQISSNICEQCGKKGQTRKNHGWLSTSCDQCNEQYNIKILEQNNLNDKLLISGYLQPQDI